MSAVISTRCSNCGANLRDRTSRMFSLGPECRKTMSDDELRAALARNTPDHIPTDKPASVRARVTNAHARQAARPVITADLCECGSGAIAGRCPPCMRETRDPMGVLAERVAQTIEEIRAERTAARDAAYHAFTATQEETRPAS